MILNNRHFEDVCGIKSHYYFRNGQNVHEKKQNSYTGKFDEKKNMCYAVFCLLLCNTENDISYNCHSLCLQE